MRLATVAQDLVDTLESRSERRQRDVAAAACRWIVDRVGLVDSRLDAGLAALRDQRFGATPERDALRQLTDELDERAWDVQAQVEEGRAPQDRFLAAFARARAAGALWFALDGDARRAVLEAVYEAQSATGDLPGARRLVESVLS